MNRLVLAALPFLLALPAAVARADGCPPLICGVSSSALPGSRVIALRPSGAAGPLVAYDTVTRTKRFQLGSGLLAADGSRFFTARRSHGRTTLARFDGRTGQRLATWSVRGRWFLGGLAPTGRWLALLRGTKRATSLAVVDGIAGDRRHAVTLRGTYQVETISPDARVLYLVHWRRGGYDLRRYDFGTRRLQATRLAEPDEKMTGIAWAGIATPDGHWLLTLYLKSAGTAFVHALDLRTGIAHCIDLPGTAGDLLTLGSYVFALSPDDRTLYLANPAMGLVDDVDLTRLAVRRTLRFAPATGFDAQVAPTAAISPNGRMLYFAAGRMLWSLDTAYHVVRGPRVVVPVNNGVQIVVAGLGFTPDGRRTVVVRTDERVVVLDAARGSVLRS